ncbi:MAG: peptidoglycan DD-metalloendopeptidase family protein [Prochloraceae cyanobacterium]|nr:peptidoglycan DD-metalloendopeptidase family protein [Prochloraceae cyanobacterium]
MLVFLQLLIPLGLLFWQGRSSTKNKLGWLIETLAVGGYLVTLAIAGLWLALPWWLAYIYLILWIGQALVRLPQILPQPRWPGRALRDWLRIGLWGLLMGVFWSLAFHGLLGYLPPAIAPVKLTFPLRNGTYLIANGGSNSLINFHLETLAPKKRAYRGQSYGVDIVKLNPLKTHGSGWLPKDLEKYAIFGDPIYAPCQGKVLAIANDRPDLEPPQVDLEHRAGNFVLLQCKDAVVLLAHLQRGSVQVVVDELVVSTNQLLGIVGNSGATGEPHLHIHAQHPGSKVTPFDGDPLPIFFGGQYLVRNSRITLTSARVVR